jgi:CubicO group peptidase (beta-lactamase class C family)
MRGLLVLAAVLLASPAAAETAWPSPGWVRIDPAAGGWSVEGLTRAGDYARSLNPTAVMVVQGGRVVAEWGDVTRKVNVRSVRKSLLGALYGIQVAEGRIDLGRTMGELGIDDNPPSLTEAEKRATVRDLLMSRSGVYHGAAYEAAEMKALRPARGSHPPGEFWYYNNWDFNALGTIYERLTGERIFESFARRIAGPIGMQDFSAADGWYITEASSVHPAYAMRLSARDLARVGWLVLNQGQWNGRQIVPAAWVTESTRPLSPVPGGRLAYGYLWWMPPDGTHLSDVLGPAHFALGNGGQVIAVMPSRQLVVVQVVDVPEGRERVQAREVFELLRRIVAATSN